MGVFNSNKYQVFKMYLHKHLKSACNTCIRYKGTNLKVPNHMEKLAILIEIDTGVLFDNKGINLPENSKIVAKLTSVVPKNSDIDVYDMSEMFKPFFDFAKQTYLKTNEKYSPFRIEEIEESDLKEFNDHEGGLIVEIPVPTQVDLSWLLCEVQENLVPGGKLINEGMEVEVPNEFWDTLYLNCLLMENEWFIKSKRVGSDETEGQIIKVNDEDEME